MSLPQQFANTYLKQEEKFIRNREFLQSTFFCMKQILNLNHKPFKWHNPRQGRTKMEYGRTKKHAFFELLKFVSDIFIP